MPAPIPSSPPLPAAAFLSVQVIDHSSMRSLRTDKESTGHSYGESYVANLFSLEQMMIPSFMSLPSVL
jgi:hypothetical protein